MPEKSDTYAYCILKLNEVKEEGCVWCFCLFTQNWISRQEGCIERGNSTCMWRICIYAAERRFRFQRLIRIYARKRTFRCYIKPQTYICRGTEVMTSKANRDIQENVCSHSKSSYAFNGVNFHDKKNMPRNAVQFAEKKIAT